jgi:uncharacterized metal-binding protein YceD (DUF177 family)
MKTRLNPIDIALKDLPPEGREFTYTNESGELNEALADLIDQNPYEVQFRITPMGNTFDLKGSVRTSMNLECSLCAMDFKFPVQQNLHEMLVVQKPLAKGDQQSKTNHAHEWTEQGPDYILLDSDVFHVDDYIHEVVGLAEPIRPLGKADCDLSCENITEPIRRLMSQGSLGGSDSIRTNPFQVLEKFKLKS